MTDSTYRFPNGSYITGHLLGTSTQHDGTVTGRFDHWLVYDAAADLYNEGAADDGMITLDITGAQR